MSPGPVSGSNRSDVTLPPWEYLFKSFNSDNFPDIFHPTWIAAAVLLGVLAVLYYVRTGALRRHAPYLDMSIPYAASSLYSTVEDLYVWDQALYAAKTAGRNGVLSAPSYQAVS